MFEKSSCFVQEEISIPNSQFPIPNSDPMGIENWELSINDFSPYLSPEVHSADSMIKPSRVRYLMSFSKVIQRLANYSRTTV